MPPVPINDRLRHELLAMYEEDLQMGDETIQVSSLYGGYDPHMEQLHRRNAKRLKEIIATHGWPGRSTVGSDGAAAAWFIARHAISDPPFQRKVLELLREAQKLGETPAMAIAFLEDLICMFEGRPQIYGTQFENDEQDGTLRPYRIADPENVNERRLAVGMNTIEERTLEMREAPQPEFDPVKYAEYRRNYERWLRKVGWRQNG